MSEQKNKKASRLVIVESPAKAKTISKYLGEGYIVKASMGHVRDLPERSLAIDVENQFRPTYEVLETRKKLIGELRKLADKAEEVFLATDLDREGEAIAWHLAEVLRLPPEKVRRVIFNEITPAAIRSAFAHPHGIDMDKVNAQQARRILDRIVGYELSPLLWKKIAKGLSAGRVQSVAVRLIVEREEEIRRFIPQEYWKITAVFTTDLSRAEVLASEWTGFLGSAAGEDGRRQKEEAEWLASRASFQAELASIGGREFKPQASYDASAGPDRAFASAAEEARRVAQALGYSCREIRQTLWEEYAHRGLKRVELTGTFDRSRAPTFAVRDIQTRRTRTRPSPPFTTASLQQAAANQIHFSTSRTMRIAQQLYEGVDIGNGEGPVGLITYMRTDSTNLSRESVEAARCFIRERYGERYLPEKPNAYATTAKAAQEAHEAIRPTDVTRTPESLRGHLTDEQFKLYSLIWKRFVACQMTPAEWDSTAVSIEAATELGPAVFRAGGRTLVFDGFYRVLGVPKSGQEQTLPELAMNQPVAAIDLRPTQHFTSPPPRYTEASLVKALEAEGIGRPSTYATIVQTIQDRGYVEQIDRRFHATDKGRIVTQKLMEHFPDLMDVKFTSYMEEELDKIEEAHLDWVRVLHEFYDPFHRSLNKAHEEMEAARSEPSPHTCPTCGRPMVYRWARTGRFLACTGYPECTTAFDVDRQGRPIVPKPVDTNCEKCGRPMVLRQSRHGHFLGCTGYPECTHTVACDAHGVPLRLVREEDLRETCEACGAPMSVKRKGRRAFLACTAFPNCKNTRSLPEGIRLEPKPAPPPEEAGVACEKCGRPMVIRTSRRGRFVSCSGFPKCRNAKPLAKLDELKAAAAARAAEGAAAEPAAEASPEAADHQAPRTPAAPAGTRPTKGSSRARRAAAPSARSGQDGQAKGASAGQNDPEFIARAQQAGFGVTRFGNLYAEKLEAELPCPRCGSKMVIKRGPWGPFLSCEGFPKCRTVARLRGQALEEARARMPAPENKPPPEPTDIDCERCGSKMVIRVGRSGKFLGCSSYPKCRSTRPIPTDMLSLGAK